MFVLVGFDVFTMGPLLPTGVRSPLSGGYMSRDTRPGDGELESVGNADITLH
jgi:hypothetical protein